MYASLASLPSSSMICAGDSSLIVVLKLTPAFFSSAIVNFGFHPLDAYSLIKESAKLAVTKISSWLCQPFTFK